MIIFPAIDLYGGKAVRLLRGDYGKMTVFSDRPTEIALDFTAKGADHIHIVDLEGARDGGTPNFDTVCEIKKASGAFCEIGGGVRSLEVIEKYLSAGIDRVILGTAAVENKELLRDAARLYGERLAVGMDIRDGKVATRGWIADSGIDAFEFCTEMQELGIGTLICTDISRDGAMLGTNRELYAELAERFSVNITASGGVSDIGDVRHLASLGIYGAIIGKAYYTGAIDLTEAAEAAK